MIKINTAQIGPEGLHIDGEEDSAILELESIHGIPVFRCSPIHYDLNATMVGQDLLVTGSAFVELETECVTCLDRIKVKVGDPKICVHIEKVPEEEVDMIFCLPCLPGSNVRKTAKGSAPDAASI